MNASAPGLSAERAHLFTNPKLTLAVHSIYVTIQATMVLTYKEQKYFSLITVFGAFSLGGKMARLLSPLNFDRIQPVSPENFGPAGSSSSEMSGDGTG
jgi:hypothetical protein